MITHCFSFNKGHMANTSLPRDSVLPRRLYLFGTHFDTVQVPGKV